MARRAHSHERRVSLPVAQSLDRVETGSGGHQSRLPGFDSNDGVCVDSASAGAAEPLQGVDELWCMDAGQLLACRRPRLHHHGCLRANGTLHPSPHRR
jgi:hypothetical protein